MMQRQRDLDAAYVDKNISWLHMGGQQGQGVIDCASSLDEDHNLSWGRQRCYRRQA
jgi:hypothetical protein